MLAHVAKSTSGRESPGQQPQFNITHNTRWTCPTQTSDQTVDVDSLSGSISPALNVGRVAIAGSEEVRVRLEGEGEVSSQRWRGRAAR